MKITRRELLVCACEVACVFLPSVLVRIAITLIKNYVRNSTDENFEKMLKI